MALLKCNTANTEKPLPECDTILWWPAVKKKASTVSTDITITETILFPFSLLLIRERW